jgi:Ca2+-binding EF-hand superfamily protein
MFEREQVFYEKRKEELRRAFVEIDRDGSGTVEPEEITNYLIQRNNIHPDEAHQMSEEIMANLDENNDGCI